MRKLFTLLLSVCLLCMCVLSASADVIWEPYGDSFYEEHRAEMQYENRFYKATADLAQYKQPNGKIEKEAVITADELFNVQYLYEDENGVLWGNCYIPGVADSAWINLVGCVRPYDRTDFTNDYESEFEPIEAQPDISFYAEEVPIYDYPGAENALYNMIVEEDSEYLPEYVHTYTDEAGNVWGEIMYFRGMNGWVLLEGDIATVQAPDKERDFPIEQNTVSQSAVSDGNAVVTPGDAAQEEQTQTVTTDVLVAAPVEKQNFAVPVVLVAAVVAVTLAVLFIFFRKKKVK